jgi:hypothetical protein
VENYPILGTYLNFAILAEIKLILGIATDAKNTSRRIFNLDQPTLGLSREYLLKGTQAKEVKVLGLKIILYI